MLKLSPIFLLFLVALRPEHAHAQPAELMLAARNGDTEEVSRLLETGAEPDPNGIATPLYFAAQGGHLEIAELLLESGADPNALSNWGTPLQIAARRGHSEVATSLLQNGADPNVVGGEFEYTPLHEAAEKGDVEMGKLLISYGADVNIQNKRFEPPIHLAVSDKRTAFADLMRASGAAAAAVDPISNALATADIEKGRVRAVECTNCHKLEKGEDAIGSYGPRLWGIVGREVAIASAREKFPYSEPMKAQTGTWTYERLNAFLADPYGTIPGQGMYAGLVRDRTERINVIAFLRTLADDPVSLP
ncbi:MAG: ankyrin repeat domain-containing protein [Sedimentitalea sp.]|uniref:ankyrin repeat domain-containing protein n=1 Tax=Sedimentitalea sp. TaxID=2048915 RepID=UPI0032664A9A